MSESRTYLLPLNKGEVEVIAFAVTWIQHHYSKAELTKADRHLAQHLTLRLSDLLENAENRDR